MADHIWKEKGNYLPLWDRAYVIFWPSTRPKNAIPRWCTGRKWHIPMTSNRKRSRGRIKAYNMAQSEGPTVPLQWCTGREWPVNYMTVISAWWRLNIRFQRSSGRSLNYYLTQLSSTSQSSCLEGSRQLETRCGRESHTRPRGSSETPMEWTPASGEQERHNVTVITVGSRYYSLCLVSSSLSHANPWTTLSNPCNKVRGKIYL